MRTSLPFRSLTALITAVGIVTCSDAATGPRKSSAARIGLVPVFSKSATYAAQHLAEFGLGFDSVRVVLRGFPDTSVVVKDTTISFSSSGPDSVVLDLSVETQTVGQQFSASLDYDGPNGVVFHGGPVKVASHAPDKPAPAQDVIQVNYVGPGHAVKAITINPKTVTLAGVTSTTFAVSAVDSTGAPTAVPPLDWTSSNTTVATVSGSNTGGAVQSLGVRGTATISATTPTNISDNATVSVVLPAASIAVVSGAGQTGKVGTTLPNPAVVQVSASDGVGVAGVTVLFAGPAGGSVGSASATTDANGRAQTTLTLGNTVGPQGFAAVAGAFSVAIGATATPGDPAAIAIVSGSGQTGVVSAPLATPLVVKVTDTFGNAASGATVSWSRTSGTGTLGAGTSTTNADGIASTTYTLGKSAGSETVSASIAGASVSFAFTATTGDPAAIAIISGSDQTARVNETLANPFVVKVTDVGGNPVPNATVSWSASNGTIAATSTTDVSGQASATMQLGSTAGAASAVAKIGNGQSVTFNAKATAAPVTAPPTLVIRTGDNQTATVGTAVATSPSVKVTDGSNNPMQGIAVTFSPATGSGNIAPAGGQVTTDASGVATLTSWTLGTTSGSQSLIASATGVGSVTFHATANPGTATKLVVTQQPPSSAVSGFTLSPQPVLQVEDQFGNAAPAGSMTVVATPSAGAASGNSVSANATSGVVTFTNLAITTSASSVTITFSASGGPSVASATSQPIAISQAAASQLILTPSTPTTYTKTAGQALSPSPSLETADAVGNAVPNTVVTFVVTQGGVQVGSTQQLTSNASGLVDEANLTILPSAAGTYTVTGSLASTPTITKSITLTVVAGTADHMVISGSRAFVADAASGTTSYPNTRPSVTVQDASNNPVSGASVYWSLGTPCSASITLGTSPTTTNSSGVATAPVITVPNGAAASCPLLTSLTNSFSSTSERFYVIMKPAGSVAWLGLSSDTAWATASNWSSGTVPTTSTRVFVPLAVPSAKLLADAVADSIGLESGVTNVRLNTHGLIVSGDVISSSGGINNGTLTLNGAGTVNIQGTLPTIIVGNASACGAFQLSGTTSAVAVTVNCPLSIGANTIVTSSDFSTAGASGFLVMTNASGLVDVNGTSTFAGASEATYLTDGTFEARGNFVQLSTVSTSSYAPSGNHKTSLWGGSNQSVSFADPTNSFFNDVEVKNAGITATFTTAATVNRDFSITSTSGTAQATFDHIVSIGRNLTANASTALVASGNGNRIIVAGTVTAAANVDLGGVDSLRVTGTTFPIYNNTTAGKGPKLTQITGAAVMTTNRTVPGGLSVTGSLELAGKTLTVLDSVNVAGTLKFLTASSGGTLTVGRRFAIVGGTVTAETGTLQLSGDFDENGTMQPAAAFLTKLTGSSAQSLSFTHPSTTGSYFGAFQVSKSSTAAATFSTDGVVTGTLTLDNSNSVLATNTGGKITAMGAVTTGNSSSMAGVVELVDSASSFPSFGGSSPATTRLAHAVQMLSDATLTGSLIVQGTLDINTHKLIINHDFTVSTGGLLKVAIASDSISVGGNAVFNGNSQDDFPFSAGAFEFKGDFTASGTETFYVGGFTGNTARFNGSSTQTISISGTSNFFANVAVGLQYQSSGFTPSNSKVTFSTDASLTGLLDLNTNAAATINTGTTLTLSAADPALNFHNGSIMHVNGTVAPSNLICQRDNAGGTPPQIDGAGTFGSAFPIIPGAGTGSTIESACSTATLP